MSCHTQIADSVDIEAIYYFHNLFEILHVNKSR